MRILLLVAVLAACGGDDGVPRPTDAELHEKVDCSAVWGGVDACERPCADQIREVETQAIPPACIGHFPAANGDRTWDCHPDALFEYMGVMGCCARPGLSNGKVIYFAVCEGE